MPALEFLTVRRGEPCIGCHAAEQALRDEMKAIGEPAGRNRWRSLDGKSTLVIRHVDLKRRHLPRELAPFILLDGTILALGPDAVGPAILHQVTRIFCPDGWVDGVPAAHALS